RARALQLLVSVVAAGGKKEYQQQGKASHNRYDRIRRTKYPDGTVGVTTTCHPQLRLPLTGVTHGWKIDQEQAQVQGAQAQGHVEGTRCSDLQRRQESEPQGRPQSRPQAQARLGRADLELVRIEREQAPDG